VIRWSAHLSLLFTELPALERPAAARAAGFGCVESWWPPAGEPAAWAEAVRAEGLAVAALNADGGDIAAGERGFCTVAERDGETFAAVRAALRLAAEVGAPAINVLAGRLAPDRPAAVQRAHAVEVLRECGRLAAAEGRIVVVEPINEHDVPGYLLPTPAAAAALLEQVAHDAVRMLYDAYHAARAGGDPPREIARYADLIGHVQYADCPGRGAPGTGEVDLWALVEALAATGYAGAIGLEFAPSGCTRESLGVLRHAPPAAPFPDPAATPVAPGGGSD
jgi:hydroxypyruvate isomerase